MAAYGYEKYYTEDGLLRYREKTATSGMATSNVSEPTLTASDIAAESASAWYAATRNKNETVQVNVTTKLDADGRTLAEVTQPYMQSLNKSNPEVVSDS